MGDVSIQDYQARTSTPLMSHEDLSQSLEDIRPFPKAPPRKDGTQRGRKKGKTAILTGDEVQ